MSPWQTALGMPVLKTLLLVILQKHLIKGSWTGRTVTTSRSLLVVVGGKLRIPWQLYWQGSLTSTQKSWRLCCKTGQHRMMLIKLQLTMAEAVEQSNML